MKCETALTRGSGSSYGRRVHHHRRVHTLERAAFEEQHLAAAAFLRRGADDVQRHAEVVDEMLERKARADRGRRDDVVTAGVTDRGQRVVLRADRDVQGTVTQSARERRREIEDAEVDVEPRVRQHAGGPRARLHLFELQLGMCVDPMTERDEIALALGDVCSGGGLGIHAGSVPPCSTPAQRLRC